MTAWHPCSASNPTPFLLVIPPAVQLNSIRNNQQGGRRYLSIQWKTDLPSFGESICLCYVCAHKCRHIFCNNLTLRDDCITLPSGPWTYKIYEPFSEGSFKRPGQFAPVRYHILSEHIPKSSATQQLTVPHRELLSESILLKNNFLVSIFQIRKIQIYILKCSKNINKADRNRFGTAVN